MQITIKTQTKKAGRKVHALFADQQPRLGNFSYLGSGYLIGSISETKDGFRVDTRNLEATHMSLNGAIREALSRVGVTEYTLKHN